MHRIVIFALTCTATALLAAAPSRADEQPTLLGMIAEWRYPEATINGATISDGETVNASGKRTVSSIKCKTVLTTNDSVEQVLDYYRAKLKPLAEKQPASKPADKSPGRSVIFHDDTAGRPLALNVIVVNTTQTSTKLVISRGKDETQTHIAWTHYRRF